MDELDTVASAFGPRASLSARLHCEVHDDELERIVGDAARALGAPMVLASLEVDQVLYFKAEQDLSSGFATAGAVPRCASFSHFVVREGLSLEVNDAADDSRVPRDLVEHCGVRSCLCQPIVSGAEVVGSLSVLGAGPRRFSTSDRQLLDVWAQQVAGRVTAFSDERVRLRRQLAEEIARAACRDMTRNIHPLFAGLTDSLAAVPELKAALRQFRQHALDGDEVPRRVIESTLRGAERALAKLNGSLHDLDAASVDCADTLLGLEFLSSHAVNTALSDVLFAAQDLTRGDTLPVGSATFGVIPENINLGLPRSVAVTLLSAALMRIGKTAQARGIGTGVRLECACVGGWVDVSLSCPGLDMEALEGVARRLGPGLSLDPESAVRVKGDHFVLRFPIAPQARACNAV